jgi:hypothetical protein
MINALVKELIHPPSLPTLPQAQVLEVDEKHYVIINDASVHARLGDPSAHLQESQEPQPTILLHGNADCIPQGAPPASCAQGATLGAVGLLSAKPENALAPVNLEGAAVGIGYVQGCGGDFFSYNKLVGAVEDVQKVRQHTALLTLVSSLEGVIPARCWLSHCKSGACHSQHSAAL